jgi:hypothetical protein
VNPLIELGANGSPQLQTASAEVFRPGSNWASLCAEYPERFSVITALMAARKEGKSPRLGILQNVSDKNFWRRHYMPFCKAFNINPHGGADESGHLYCSTYDNRGGHGVYPDILALQKIINVLLEKPVRRASSQPVKKLNWWGSYVSRFFSA